MDKEFLKKLGVADDDVIEKIMKDHTDNLESVKKQLKDTADQLTAANKKIEEFGKLDYEGVKKLADDYKAKYNESVKAAEQFRFDSALDAALTAAKARNTKSVKVLLNCADIKFGDDGKLIGLDEQLKKVKKENDYLFEEEEKKPSDNNNNDNFPRFGGSSNNPGTAVTNASAREIMGLPALK